VEEGAIELSIAKTSFEHRFTWWSLIRMCFLCCALADLGRP
jgi:hypothetical protein